MSSAVNAADCERAAIRAYLLGADDDCDKHWESAHRAALDAGDPAESARYAFWLALGLMLRGQVAPASGWLSRAQGLITQAGTECPAAGYVLIPRCLIALDTGNARDARDMAATATEIGIRCGDADLRALGTLAHGQALIATGEQVAGLARLDEVMVSVTAGELSAITTGIVYCAVILECMNLYDLRRASEWTNALAAWCDARPEMVPFRGQCLVHRSQLAQANGDWTAAVANADRACRCLVDPPHPALGLAYYQQGELHRLLGDVERAAKSYRLAGKHGHDPMPGLALLQLVRDDVTTAVATIQRALHEPSRPRPAILAAAVEIYRAAGDFVAARTSADELSGIAADSTSAVLQATAKAARGSVLLATGDASGALAELRAAAQSWHALRMPYDAAKAAVLLGLACAALRDLATAEIQFDSASEIFTELGATPDLKHVTTLAQRLTPGQHGAGPGGLTPREQQVLTLLVAGRTNREIAEELVVSPHTVARHIEHIYAKFGVTNRTAATAYAHEQRLV
jgi:DNA-binding NarL/FixJ family response regulator